MARSGRSRASSGNGSMLASDNSNVLGSLLSSLTFGIFDIHQCDSEDESWYCKLSRFFGALIKVIFLAIIFYVGYLIFLKPRFGKSFKGGMKKR